MSYSGTVLLVVFGIILLVFGTAFFFAGIFITGIILILIGIILLFLSKLGISQFISSYKMQKGLSNRSPYMGSINSFQNSNNTQGFPAISNSSYGNIKNYYFKQPKRIGKNSIIAYVILLFILQVFIGTLYAYILILLFVLFYFKKSPAAYGTGRFKFQDYSGTVYGESDGLE